MLTVWLDPGRIKRGLHPNQLYGAPLQLNEHYTLVISHDWKDIRGAKLAMPYSKKFVVTTRDSLSPNPNTWMVHSPRISTSQPLIVDFKSPLDYSLLLATLHVTSNDNETVAGLWEIGQREKTASFTPAVPWHSGDYLLQVETRLEDLAGNNLNKPFEVDIRDKSIKPATTKMIAIHFACTK